MTKHSGGRAWTVTLCVDGVIDIPTGAIVDADDRDNTSGQLSTSSASSFQTNVNYFVMRKSDEICLIDAGIGSAWGPRFGRSRQKMFETLLNPSDVSKIFLTHIHHDHVLGLFEGDEAYFPNAQILIYRSELDGLASSSQASSSVLLWERIRRIYGTHRIDVLHDFDVEDGITLYPLPGHTFGHVGYLIEVGEHKVFLGGDIIHVESLQIADPRVGIVYDLSPSLAEESRRKALDLVTDTGTAFSGGHISSFFRVNRSASGFKLLPLDPAHSASLIVYTADQ